MPRPQDPQEKPGPLMQSRHYWQSISPNQRGAFWILIAGFFFILMSTFIKLLGERLHITQILFIRQCLIALIAAPTLMKVGLPALKTEHPKLHAARLTFALIAMLCGFQAVIHLPLADVTAISFSKSLFTTLFAILILKEVVGARRWLATFIGFAGMLIMVRPTGGTADFYNMLAIISAASAGLVMIILRLLSRHDQPITILAYQALGAGTLLAPFGIWYWVTPNLFEMALFLALAGVAYIAQYANIRAYRDGEASFIASLDFVRLLYATLIGIIIFADWPTWHTILGGGLIACAALYTLQREKKKGHDHEARANLTPKV